MKYNIHLRGVDATMMAKLKQEAQHKDMSVNNLILLLLRHGLGLGGKKTQEANHNLDSLAGTWSKKDAEQFFKTITDMEKIDEDMWL